MHRTRRVLLGVAAIAGSLALAISTACETHDALLAEKKKRAARATDADDPS
jgi:hypothetical protein